MKSSISTLLFLSSFALTVGLNATACAPNTLDDSGLKVGSNYFGAPIINGYPALSYPLLKNDGVAFTSPYGPRWGRMHRGIDLAGPAGTPIAAPMGGTVIDIQRPLKSRGYGWFLELGHIDHEGHSFTTRLAHFLRAPCTDEPDKPPHSCTKLLKKGDRVEECQLVGLMGKTGNTTGVHLHLEVRRDGLDDDPAPLIWKKTTGITSESELTFGSCTKKSHRDIASSKRLGGERIALKIEPIGDQLKVSLPPQLAERAKQDNTNDHAKSNGKESNPLSNIKSVNILVNGEHYAINPSDIQSASAKLPINSLDENTLIDFRVVISDITYQGKVHCSKITKNQLFPNESAFVCTQKKMDDSQGSEAKKYEMYLFATRGLSLKQACVFTNEGCASQPFSNFQFVSSYEYKWWFSKADVSLHDGNERDLLLSLDRVPSSYLEPGTPVAVIGPNIPKSSFVKVSTMISFPEF